MAVIAAYAVNDPKKLKDEIPKIAPVAPEKPREEISPYGERLVGGYVADWWQDAYEAT